MARNCFPHCFPPNPKTWYASWHFLSTITHRRTWPAWHQNNYALCPALLFFSSVSSSWAWWGLWLFAWTIGEMAAFVPSSLVFEEMLRLCMIWASGENDSSSSLFSLGTLSKSGGLYSGSLNRTSVQEWIFVVCQGETAFLFLPFC